MVAGLLSGFSVSLDQMDGSLGFAGETGTKKGNLAFVSLYVFDPTLCLLILHSKQQATLMKTFFNLSAYLWIWGPKSVEYMGSLCPSVHPRFAAVKGHAYPAVHAADVNGDGKLQLFGH